jgi:hypothetical protein
MDIDLNVVPSCVTCGTPRGIQPAVMPGDLCSFWACPGCLRDLPCLTDAQIFAESAAA